MTDKRPKPGTKEFDEWLRKRAKATADELFKKGPTDFDECGIIFGDDESLKSSDAEAFPDEMEEYHPEEKKPRPIPTPKK